VLPDHFIKDVCGVGKGGIDVAIRQRKFPDNVGVKVAVSTHGAVLDRIAAVADRVKQVVIDDEQGGRILGNVAGIGNYYCDRLANIIDFVSRQNRLGARHRDCWIWQQHRHRLAAHRFGQVISGQDRMDARNAYRLFAINATKPGVGVRRTNEAGVQHARQLHVVDKAPAPGKQCRIFKPMHARAKKFCAHRSTPRHRCLHPRHSSPQMGLIIKSRCAAEF
jgi:hypothetical protein